MLPLVHVATWLEWLIKIAAGLAACGVIWSKAAKPAFHFIKRIGDGVEYVQSQMVNNGGSTLKDAVDTTAKRVDEIATRLDQIDARVEFLELIHRKQEEVDRIVAENAARLSTLRPPLHLPNKETPHAS